MRIIGKRKILYWVCLLTAAALVFSGYARISADDSTLQMKLPVKVSFGSGSLSAEKEYRMVLTPEEADEPMPADAVDGVCTRAISKANGTDYSFTIGYSDPGEYWYSLVIEDSGKKALGTWWLHVTVMTQDGKRSLSTSLHENEKNGMKTDSIHVVDEDQPFVTSTNTPTPTPSSSGSTGGGGSSSSGSSQSTGRVLTGDTSRTGFWVTTMAISAALLILIAGKIRRKKKEN